jgi:hypothetical protein
MEEPEQAARQMVRMEFDTIVGMGSAGGVETSELRFLGGLWKLARS